MSRLLLFIPALAVTIAGALALGLAGTDTVRGDVGGVYSNVPVFTPNQVVTITVEAEDDDGTLIIESSLPDSQLTVTNCSGIGNDQAAGECDGSGMDAISDQGSDEVRIDTNALDEDDETELLTVSLTLIADCEEPASVTVSGDQPGNFGPDDVTINCEPSTPTPTPSPTPSPTLTASPTYTPTPTFTPQPPAAPTTTPFSEIHTSISPPNTGSAGLR